MKRNMDIIRAILLKVEEKCPPYEMEVFTSDDFIEFNWPEVWAHYSLLEDEKYFQLSSKELGMNRFSVNGLSWKGHDFLDSIRDDDIWRKTKESAIKIKDFSFETISRLAKAYVKKKIEESTGLSVE